MFFIDRMGSASRVQATTSALTVAESGQQRVPRFLGAASERVNG